MDENNAVAITVEGLLDLTEIETDYQAIFASYREYVNLCLEVAEDVPTLSEFRKVA